MNYWIILIRNSLVSTGKHSFKVSVSAYQVAFDYCFYWFHNLVKPAFHLPALLYRNRSWRFAQNAKMKFSNFFLFWKLLFQGTACLVNFNIFRLLFQPNFLSDRWLFFNSKEREVADTASIMTPWLSPTSKCIKFDFLMYSSDSMGTLNVKVVEINDRNAIENSLLSEITGKQGLNWKTKDLKWERKWLFFSFASLSAFFGNTHPAGKRQRWAR